MLDPVCAGPLMRGSVIRDRSCGIGEAAIGHQRSQNKPKIGDAGTGDGAQAKLGCAGTMMPGPLMRGLVSGSFMLDVAIGHQQSQHHAGTVDAGDR